MSKAAKQNDDSSSSSDSESQKLTLTKNGTPQQKKNVTKAADKKGSVAKIPTTQADDSDSSDSEVAKAPVTKAPVTKAPVTKAPVGKGNAAKTTTQADDSDSSDSEEAPVTKAPVGKGKAGNTTAAKAKQTPTKAAAKESSDESSSSEKVTPAKNLAAGKKKEKSAPEEAKTTKKDSKKGKKKQESSGDDMVTSEGNGEESGSSSEMHIDLGGKKKDADAKGVKRKREDNGDEEGNKKRKLNNGGGTGNTKVRLGNLAFDLDGQIDEIKKQFADCGTIKNVQMITRQDGRFAGVAIMEFEDTDSAASALEKHDQDFYGRKMNLSYSTEEAGGGRPNRGGNFNRPPSEKPEGCTTCFIGNLSYDITDNQVYEFFADCGDIKEVRWPKGDFTGIGWVEFYDSKGPDMAIAKAGQNLLGRSIRVDFAAPRKPRFE